jgi:Ca2+/H+ antiporter, TMEM165/GDT1 family
VDGFWVALGVIFVAELGDKSQLMALAFSTRFSAWRVLIGITIATAITHAISVGIGDLVGANLPTRWVNLIAGLAFVGFAWWTWRGDELDEDDEQAAARVGRAHAWRAIGAIGVTFFLAELGDKTMLATITLATKDPWFAVWLGSTIGMVAADALAIVVGRQLGARLPERAIRVGATLAFVAFGALLLVEAASG